MTTLVQTDAFEHLKDGIKNLSLALHHAHTSICDANITMALTEVPQDQHSLSFISYNLLADVFAANRAGTTLLCAHDDNAHSLVSSAAGDEGHTQGQFDHVDAKYLAWDYRFELLQRDVQLWNADILCFQEVSRGSIYPLPH
jgi:hypothetical protein